MKTITIYLGSRCNLNCAYCHREADADERGVTDKLLTLLKEERPQEIRFFGGEPTLYMDDIQKVVATCPWAAFVVTTNGVLLDKYKDYFSEHNFKIIVSYDGNTNSLRGYNPLLKAIDYHKLGVSTTLYHGNTDFKSILRHFCEMEKYAGRSLSFFPHIAHHTNDSNKEYALTADDIKQVLAEYKHCIKSFWQAYEKYGLINIRYKAVFTQLWREYNASYEFGETYCVGKERMKVNANGDTFNCLYIRNVPESENAAYIRSRFPRCEKCHYYSMCGAACVQSLSHDLECSFYYQLYDFFAHFVEGVPPEKLKRLVRLL